MLQTDADMASGDQEIVWPEHLFDVDHLSVDDEAASQTSQGSDGLSRPSDRAARPSPSRQLSYPTEAGPARTYWDHDNRDYASSRYVFTFTNFVSCLTR